MNPNQKNIAFWILMVLTLSLGINFYLNRPQLRKAIGFSEFLNQVQAQNVEEVTIQGEEYQGKFKGEGLEGMKYFVTIGPAQNDKALEQLTMQGVKVEFRKENEESFLRNLLVYWLPLILLGAVLFFMIRQMQVGSGKALSFGKSRARLQSDSKKRITFQDVAGADEAKEELREIIDFLKDPQKFTKLGGRIPKGVLLMGSPGTGKTLLAKAVAGEAGVPFYSISGSDFVEMFVGVGAARVRDLFEQGKKNAPCIIFIDEIDAVGRHRGAGLGGGHDEREQTLNQLLVEMDGFEGNDGVILMAATNRPDVLDPALLRPGRFDRRVMVPRPDLKGRQEILGIHVRRVPLDADVDLAKIARGTPGFSGADLENLVNEAALFAARKDQKVVVMKDFEMAKDKVLMGSERRSMIMSEEERRTTAYHEAGHTLVAMNLPEADPVHKVTIIPRGMALGLTQQLPEQDKYSQSSSYAETQISILMGGRLAEEIVLGQKTTGAGNDIERATEIARRMVCEWGMSQLGPLTFGRSEEQPFLGRDIQRNANYSEATAQRIDDEINSIIIRNYDRAKFILEKKRAELDLLAIALLEYEVLNSEEIVKVVRGEALSYPPLKPLVPGTPQAKDLPEASSVHLAPNLNMQPGQV